MESSENESNLKKYLDKKTLICIENIFRLTLVKHVYQNEKLEKRSTINIMQIGKVAGAGKAKKISLHDEVQAIVFKLKIQGKKKNQFLMDRTQREVIHYN